MVYTVFYKTSSSVGYCFLSRYSIHPQRHDVFSFMLFEATLVKIQICSFIEVKSCRSVDCGYNPVFKTLRNIRFGIPHNRIFLCDIKMQIHTSPAELNHRFTKPHCIAFFKISPVILMCKIHNYKFTVFYVF